MLSDKNYCKKQTCNILYIMLSLENIEVRKELKSFIRKITLFKSDGCIEYMQRLMPSGYSYLSYNQSNLPCFKVGRKTFNATGKLHVVGPKTINEISVYHKGIINQVLIEFSAFGFYSLFNCSPLMVANSLTNFGSIKLDDRLEELNNELALIVNIADCAIFLQEYLVNISTNATNVDKRIIKVISEIESKNGILSVKEAYKYAEIGERHFNRLFREIVGCSPKLFIKILQLHSIITKMKQDVRMLDLAYDSGFYDQAHFNKSFKNMVGMSPNQFLRSSEHVSFQYFKE